MSKSFRQWVTVALLATLSLFTTPTSAQTTPLLPLGGIGPYAVGYRVTEFKDASRDGRTLQTWIWYPAIAPDKPTDEQTANKKNGWLNAVPDTKNAPYPLILFSVGFNTPIARYYGNIYLQLASHGFVIASMSHPMDETPTSFVDRPLDVLFVLNRLAELNQSDFGGLMDTDHVGVMGHSFGAYTTLAMTGARIDPTSARAWGDNSTGPADDSNPNKLWRGWNWDTIAAYRAKLSPLNADDLWPPFTDKRILATLMLSPCVVPMFGERGLAAATVPSLMVDGTDDTNCPYEIDSVYAFTHLGSPDRYLLSAVKGNHFSYYDEKHLPALTQFETAFFGYYLQSKKDYAQYLTAKYVDSVEAELKLGFAWGPYSGK